jgi:hypothetical protein
MPKILKNILIAACAIFLIILALYSFSFWYMNTRVFASEKFEKEAWHTTTTNDEDSTCYRGAMAKDIRDNLLSNTTTKEDVNILLGAPESNFTNSEYKYALGMCSGLGFDYDYLHIYFDEQGHFSHAKIIQH